MTGILGGGEPNWSEFLEGKQSLCWHAIGLRIFVYEDPLNLGLKEKHKLGGTFPVTVHHQVVFWGIWCCLWAVFLLRVGDLLNLTHVVLSNICAYILVFRLFCGLHSIFLCEHMVCTIDFCIGSQKTVAELIISKAPFRGNVRQNFPKMGHGRCVPQYLWVFSGLYPKIHRFPSNNN